MLDAAFGQLDSLVFCLGKLDLVWFFWIWRFFFWKLDLVWFFGFGGFSFGNWIWFGFSGYVALSINNTKIPCLMSLHKSKTTLLLVFSNYSQSCEST
jgi:hypothetical protein